MSRARRNIVATVFVRTCYVQQTGLAVRALRGRHAANVKRERRPGASGETTRASLRCKVCALIRHGLPSVHHLPLSAASSSSRFPVSISPLTSYAALRRFTPSFSSYSDSSGDLPTRISLSDNDNDADVDDRKLNSRAKSAAVCARRSAEINSRGAPDRLVPSARRCASPRGAF